MKSLVIFIMVALAHQAMSKKTPEPSKVEWEIFKLQDRETGEEIDWDESLGPKIPMEIYDVEPVQKWYEDIMSSMWNEILYKAKLFLTAESSLEEIVEKHDVSFNASLFMKTWARHQMSKILDAEEKYFKVAYGKAEKEALEEMAHGSEQANNIVRDLAEDYGLDKYIV